MFNMFLSYVLFHLISLALFTKHAEGDHWKAPNIVHHPKSELSYKPGEDLTLSCAADVGSSASYEWKKDGKQLNLNETNVVMSANSGNIVIRAPSEENDGVYQCFVRNQFGTALSSKATVRKAVLFPFPTVLEPTIKSPVVGRSLSLFCSPPKSFPKGNVYWGINRPYSNKLEAIENSDRIILDYEGNLHFANVVPGDSLGGTSYVCIVHNALLGAYVQGNDHKITPVEVLGGPRYYPPKLLWSSPSIDIAIRGQTKRIKCIFSGLPTPVVTWRRLDHGQRSGGRTVISPELEMANVEAKDAGQYECQASNSDRGTVVRNVITVIVQSAPFWSQRRSPSSIQIEEESNVEIDCQANGTPTPSIVFLTNGVPLEELPRDSRRSVNKFKITLRNVTTSDSQVIQCIASNEHGTILANIIVSVTATPPSFLETPSNAKVVEGQSAMFRCLAYGAPKPVITWRKGKSVEPVSGDRFVVHSSGIFEIKNTALSDSDVYRCHVVNKFGTDEVSVNLTVRLPTKILPSVENVTVNAGQKVVLPCDIRSDPSEWPHLVVEWQKNRRTIDLSEVLNLKMHSTNFSLEMSQSRVDDSASYSCHVRSSVDSVDSTPVVLKVKDRPDPPYDVVVSTCAAKYAIISWKVGSDNNDPQLEFVVFYNSSVNGSEQFVEGARITAKESSGFVLGQEVQAVAFNIRPWSVYSFFVTSKNLIGTSDRSLPSEPCVTSQMLPERNPGGVCSKRKGPTQLVIVWESIPRSDWNGEGFHYIVSYRPLHSRKAVESRIIKDPHQTELEVNDLSVFTAFEIYVESANSVGVRQISHEEKRIGYTGEGKPLDSPVNFQLLNLTSTYGEFSWYPIDTSPERVRGFFKGYRVKFWRSIYPDYFREVDIILVNDTDLCPPLDDRRRRSVRSSDKITGNVGNLWPYSVITAGVSVINHAHSGPLSDTVEFQTPEGVPGKVSSVEVVERGSSHLRIKWDIPEEPNGVVIGYEVSYQVAPPAVGRLQSVYLSGVERLSKKLLGLEFSTEYLVLVSAVTAAGVGDHASVFGKTLPPGAPDRPTIESVETGDDSANLTWSPSIHPIPVNPGHSFYLRWKFNGENQWTNIDIDPESDENWINVTDLVSGSYEFQVVAVNGLNELTQETRSGIATAYLGPEIELIEIPVNPVLSEDEKNVTYEEVTEFAETAPVIHEKALSYWFILLSCVIICLLLILCIVCIARHSRGNVYSVSKKEKLCGHDPYAPEDVPFGEYNRRNSRSSKIGGSEISIESDEKVVESDSDSLEEYDQTDLTKFTEDGSFIGLYVGKNKNSEDVPVSALDTFI